MSYLLTIKQAAEDAQLSDWFIKKEIREGRLVAKRFGRVVRIERKEYERWISCRDSAVRAQASDGEPRNKAIIEVFETKVGSR